MYTRPKTYAYLLDDDNEIKKVKVTKIYVIKHILMFENYRDSLFNDKTIMKSQLRSTSDHHNMYTDEINKIELNITNDNKRLQTFDGITTYPFGTNAFKVCESEMLTK